MRGVWIHGGLLVIALLWGFQTWTRERPSLEERERVVVWEADTASVESVAFRSAAKDVQFVRRTEGAEDFWWGIEVDRPAARGTGSAQSVAQADTLEFPVGRPGTDLISRLGTLRVLRDLGPPSEEQVERFGFTEPVARITVATSDGLRQLEIGASVYGGSDRYAFDPAAERAYVVSNDVVRPFQTGSGAVRERVLHYFDDSDVFQVRVVSRGQDRVMERVSSGAGWAQSDAPDRPDQTFANFLSRVSQLAIAGFEERVSPESVESLLRVEYADEDLEPLGFLELYRGGATGQDYYLMSERTRVLAEAVRSLAETVAQDLAAVF